MLTRSVVGTEGETFFPGLIILGQKIALLILKLWGKTKDLISTKESQNLRLANCSIFQFFGILYRRPWLWWSRCLKTFSRVLWASWAHLWVCRAQVQSTEGLVVLRSTLAFSLSLSVIVRCSALQKSLYVVICVYCLAVCLGYLGTYSLGMCAIFGCRLKYWHCC